MGFGYRLVDSSILRPCRWNHATVGPTWELQRKLHQAFARSEPNLSHLGQSSKMHLLGGLWSFGDVAQLGGTQMRLSRFQTLVSGHDHKMATERWFYDHRVFRRHRVRVANGNRASRSGAPGYRGWGGVVRVRGKWREQFDLGNGTRQSCGAFLQGSTSS